MLHILNHLPRRSLGPHACLICDKRTGSSIDLSILDESERAFDLLEQNGVHALKVMSFITLLKKLAPIARAHICGRCLRVKVVGRLSEQINGITTPWANELRTKVAALNEPGATSTQKRSSPIDLTRKHTRANRQLECAICNETVETPAHHTCFRCHNVLHTRCWEGYRDSQDANQLTSLSTSRETLDVPCVYCRQVVLSVKRSRNGMACWDNRTKMVIQTDHAYAMSLQ